MRIVVLGGNGFVGATIVRCLSQRPALRIVVASRAPRPRAEVECVAADTRDRAALARALEGADAVVNCVTGDASTIANGAHTLAQAAGDARVGRIVHLSSMAVYGSRTGTVDESIEPLADIGWYGAAKIEAERAIAGFAAAAQRQAWLLRIGCVNGADSPLWTRRLAGWLRSHRLGDLGASGDGWSNLVHVQDIARAVEIACLGQTVHADGPVNVLNLAAPDSPRWNRWFIDLGVAIGATPIATVPSWRLALEGRAIAPPLKLAERLADRLRLPRGTVPEAMPPSLLRLFRQSIRLDSARATHRLGLRFTDYDSALRDSAGSCSPLAADPHAGTASKDANRSVAARQVNRSA